MITSVSTVWQTSFTSANTIYASIHDKMQNTVGLTRSSYTINNRNVTTQNSYCTALCASSEEQLPLDYLTFAPTWTSVQSGMFYYYGPVSHDGVCLLSPCQHSQHTLARSLTRTHACTHRVGGRGEGRRETKLNHDQTNNIIEKCTFLFYSDSS